MVIDFSNVLVFVLVMARMTGMLVLHPILGRNNVPSQANLALAFLMTVLLTRNMPVMLEEPTMFLLIVWIIKEILLGVVVSVVMRLFLSLLVIGGEIVDMQIGLSMAKAFDPGNNASISLNSQFFNTMFLVIFFLSNSHLTFLKLMTQTLQLIPLGSYLINVDALYLVPELFTNIFLLGVKLSLPVVVVEIIVTFAVGIIMRIVPQINVFVVNIQFNQLVGMLVIVMLVPTFSAFMENMVIIATENIWSILGEVTSG